MTHGYFSFSLFIFIFSFFFFLSFLSFFPSRSSCPPLHTTLGAGSDSAQLLALFFGFVVVGRPSILALARPRIPGHIIRQRQGKGK